jgi:hypothetical protein
LREKFFLSFSFRFLYEIMYLGASINDVKFKDIFLNYYISLFIIFGISTSPQISS